MSALVFRARPGTQPLIFLTGTAGPSFQLKVGFENISRVKVKVKVNVDLYSALS